jgi:hypothetical protein
VLRPSTVRLVVRIEFIPIIGYTGGLRRRHGRPSREHQEYQARWSAQVRCRALVPARPDRVVGSRAAPRPNEPELAEIAKRTRETAATKGTRDAQQAFQTGMHERTHGRPIRTNPSLLAPMSPSFTMPNEPGARGRPLPHARERIHGRANQTNPSLIPPARCGASGRPAAATNSHGPMDHANKR